MLRNAPIRAYIPASNMTRTRKFYEEIVGLQPKEEYAGGVYLNLASRMKLTGMNQLWTADITYIRLKKEFVLLAAILEACSRKVVGWSLDRLWNRPSPNGSPHQVWCIIPIVVCSTLPS